MGGGFGGLDCRLYLGCEISKPNTRTNKVLLNMEVWTMALTAQEVALALQWPLPGKSSEAISPGQVLQGTGQRQPTLPFVTTCRAGWKAGGRQNGGYGKGGISDGAQLQGL